MGDPYVAAFAIAAMFLTTLTCIAVGSLVRWVYQKIKGE